MKTLGIACLLSIFCSCPLFGNSYKDYISYTNKAELAIVMGNVKQAQACYDTAFSFWKKPFAVDLYNDLRCANIDSNFQKVHALAKQLLGLGCPLTLFDTPEYLRKFRTSSDYVALINEYPSIRSKYIRNNDWKLRIQIEKLRAKDQVLRQQSNNYTQLRDSLYKADDTIKTELLNIFKQGFPNEYNYGVFLYNDTTLMEYEPLHLIILHNYSKFDVATLPNPNTKNMDFTAILMKAVKGGRMHPMEFAYLNDRSGKYMIGKGYWQTDILMNIHGKLYYNNASKQEETDVDKNRSELGLGTIGEEKAKALFFAQNKNKFIMFRHMGNIVKMKGMEFTEQQMKLMFTDTGITID